jgi:hypothetical protein
MMQMWVCEVDFTVKNCLEKNERFKMIYSLKLSCMDIVFLSSFNKL